MQEQTGPATWAGLVAANIAAMDALDVLLSRHTDDELTIAILLAGPRRTIWRISRPGTVQSCIPCVMASAAAVRLV